MYDDTLPLNSDAETMIFTEALARDASYVLIGTTDIGIEEFNTPDGIACIPADGALGALFVRQSLPIRFVSRCVDICISSLALLVFMPVMLLIALIIRLDSPGPVLFFQKRVARSRFISGRELMADPSFQVLSGNVDPERNYWVPRTFHFLKFRTMYADARIRFPHLYDYRMTSEQIERFQFKVENDPRVSRAGRWLRASTLDELPNFWNVLTGEMRLAGPRPEIPEMLPNYRPEQMAKFTVKPGVSGLAQINGRGRLTFQKTVSYDLEYIRTRSFLMDLSIIAKTLLKVFKRNGAF